MAADPYRRISPDTETELPLFLFRASAFTDASAAALIAAHCTREQQTRLFKFFHPIDRFRGLGSIVLQRWLITWMFPQVQLAPDIFKKSAYGKPFQTLSASLEV